MPYGLLKKLGRFESRSFPAIACPEDRDIVLAVGEAQASGQRISFKQLDASDICSTATLRRRLYRLIKLGVLLRQTSAEDRRVAWLVLSRRYQLRFKGYRAALKAAVLEMLTTDGAVAASKALTLPAFLDSARAPEEFAKRLRGYCEQFGAVRHISLSCLQSPASIFAAVECEDGAGLAKASGGAVFGRDTVCIRYAIPRNFACEFLDRKGSCLHVFR